MRVLRDTNICLTLEDKEIQRSLCKTVVKLVFSLRELSFVELSNN